MVEAPKQGPLFIIIITGLQLCLINALHPSTRDRAPPPVPYLTSALCFLLLAVWPILYDVVLLQGDFVGCIGR